MGSFFYLWPHQNFSFFFFFLLRLLIRQLLRILLNLRKRAGFLVAFIQLKRMRLSIVEISSRAQRFSCSKEILTKMR